jgi:hypothetical protein
MTRRGVVKANLLRGNPAEQISTVLCHVHHVVKKWNSYQNNAFSAHKTLTL